MVRKVIRSQATEFRYERDVQPQPKIGPWRDRLNSLLLENDGKPARERLTLIRVFEELRGLGYEGGYDAVRRYARTWSKQHAGETANAYVPLTFAPGEAYQFDWSHEIVVMDGVTTIVKVAHVRLCHSRMMLARAYPRETQEMVFDAHERAFAFFRGACTRGIYDNMKTAVETIFVGKDRQYNRPFLPARRRRAGDGLDKMVRAHLDPMPRKPIGEKAMTDAERQARYRVARAADAPVIRTRRPADHRSRARRWQDAVAQLSELQAQYADWLEALPANQHDSALAEALQAI